MRSELIRLVQEKALTRGRFSLTGGLLSDFYIDLSKIVLDSHGLSLVSEAIIEEVNNWSRVTTIGGPACGAIGIITSLLTLMHDSGWAMKGFFVREEPKKYGQLDLIEGHLEKGDKVILIDDVTTTGNSLLKVVEKVQELAEICQIISVVDRKCGAAELFKEKGIPFKAILTIDQIL
jgi:orotate phosphoribosyltransferase